MRGRRRGQRLYAYTDLTLPAPSSSFRKTVRYLVNGGSARHQTDKDHANLITSKTDTGWHMPVLDLDVPHYVVPSSKPGHGHLYIDVRMPWRKYALLLLVMRYCRILERGFVLHSLRRRATYARLPHIRKPGYENRCALCGDGSGPICSTCRGIE